MEENNIEQAILALLDERGASRTACPSEVARQLAGDDGPWRELMPQVRRVADQLAEEGRIQVRQRGARVSAVQAVGPIRLAKPSTKR